jgi:bidirectional [NiFe] hydrogenase diaphorase subunit
MSIATTVEAPSKPPQVKAAAKGHPSGDNRYLILEATMKRHQYQPDALIEVLHSAQQLFGFLDDELMMMIAHKLKVPPSRVYGVATFYHFFSLKPAGKHTCIVCLGTACYVKGANKLLESAGAAAGIKPGETTADGNVSLLSARCLGACGIAPAVIMDGNVRGNESIDGLTGQIKEWLKDGS